MQSGGRGSGQAGKAGPSENMTGNGKKDRRGIKHFAITFQDELVDRIAWFIRVRWLAGLGVSGTILLTGELFDLLVNRGLLLGVASLIFIANLAYLIYFRRLRKHGRDTGWRRKITRLANVQISVDLVLLTVLLYFSGGVENPFCFYFIFHIIIASILLSTTASYLQATLAVLLFNLMLLLDYLRVIPHHPLFPFMSETVYEHPLFLIGSSVVLTSTLYISVYMATSITSRLREREQELVEVKDSLERANIELEQLHEYRSRFILRVEHEMKAPLAAIQSLITVILTTFGKTLEPKVKELLERSEKRVLGLLSMIRELIELSRMKMAAFHYDMQPLDPAPLIERQTEIVRHQAENKRLELRSRIRTDLPRIVADRQALAQVVMNLLSNAVKYTERGTVDIEASSGEGSLLISVSDTGIGMTDEEKENLFEEFFRGSRAKGMSEGTGLGLSIVREIVEAHGGSLDVRSEAGVGSTFTVSLPLEGKSPSDGMSKAQPSAATPETSG